MAWPAFNHESSVGQSGRGEEWAVGVPVFCLKGSSQPNISMVWPLLKTRNLNFRKVGSFTNSIIGKKYRRFMPEMHPRLKFMLFLCYDISSWSLSTAQEVLEG